MSKWFLRLLLPVLAAGCVGQDPIEDLPETGFQLLDPAHTGVDFVNQLVETDSLNILDYLYLYNGGGVGIGDLNNDGLPDLYFSANQGPNHLYLNKGDLQFQDVTKQAGVGGNSDWNTGVLLFDVNADGQLDIYVSAVVGIAGFEGHHELFVNNGDGTFTERAKEYGLDARVYGTGATILDYDKDGDLDLFLLNHAVHTQESFGRSSIRGKRDSLTGDRLMRNDGDRFVDVSEEAGIYGGVNGYGLGVSVADFNADGWPDIYVGNDFHEDDYYYLNQGDGTFKESLKAYFGHSSRFSMGNDAADINADGLPDLISLDMLPWDETVLKSSEGDDTFETLKLRTAQYGYHYQFTRNMLFVNRAGAPFQETALMSGVAATDWSWSALFADFDQDGRQDLVISNGIPRRPNNLDFIRFLSNEQIQQQVNSSRLVDRQALDLMPAGEVPNKAYKGAANLQFEDMSQSWFGEQQSVSGATAMADLDGDGDLDLVMNNINGVASLYENRLDTGSFLRIRPSLEGMNPFGIGTKVYAYNGGRLVYRELNPVRGFQATSEAVLHIGLGPTTSLDSLKIVWPDGRVEQYNELTLNREHVLTPGQGVEAQSVVVNKQRPFIRPAQLELGIDYVHKALPYADFSRQKLIPYGISNPKTPAVWADLNGDGQNELFIGGNKQTSSVLYRPGGRGFEPQPVSIDPDRGMIMSAAEIVDLDLDGELELILGTSGGDLARSLSDLATVRAGLDEGGWTTTTMEIGYHNTAVIRAADIEGDGDLDLFVGNRLVTNDFGAIPPSFLLVNQNGELVQKAVEGFEDLGMVTDASWGDFNGDGTMDLVVVGEWMQPRFFENIQGALREVDLLDSELDGLWQLVLPFDIDHDGDLDYILGNWGMNSKFNASEEFPLRMYYSDFDNNGSTETVLANGSEAGYYPLLGLDDLAAQMVFLRKRYPSYTAFAGQTIDEIFSAGELDGASLFEVNTLESGFLRNNGSGFNFVAFPYWLQLAPVRAGVVADLDADGTDEVVLGGNFVDLIPYHGRLDSFEGALIRSETQMIQGNEAGLDLGNKVITNFLPLEWNKQPFLLVLVENGPAELYQIDKIVDQ